jgi:alkylhydroperoxidase family enzyme
VCVTPLRLRRCPATHFLHDPKADAAVRFALKLVRDRGYLGESDLLALKAAGYGDAQVIEIVLHVALDTWTNFVNVVGGTEIDFPVTREVQLVPGRSS